MLRIQRRISYGLTLVACLYSGDLVAQDLPGSQDHPLVSRIPGSEIRQYEHEEFGQLVVPLGQATGKNQFADQLVVEGRLTRIGYALPEDRGPLEAYRQYREALVEAGFEVLWSCERGNACGGRFASNFNENPGEKSIFHGEAIAEADEYYLAARLPRPEGDVLVQVFAYPTWANRGDWARVRVVEARPMEAGLVTVDADAMWEDLQKTGRVAIYGVTFDHDSAAIRPESNPTLDEMARLLNDNVRLSVYIVGHTDTTGAFDYNMNLSGRRAAAVADALVDRGIARDRLLAHGVGPLSPVASNDTDEGRGRNRRVEMVKRAQP